MSASAEFVTEITRVQRQLHAFILTTVWNPIEADDVLQETNLVLWQKWPNSTAAASFSPGRCGLPNISQCPGSSGGSGSRPGSTMPWPA